MISLNTVFLQCLFFCRDTLRKGKNAVIEHSLTWVFSWSRDFVFCTEKNSINFKKNDFVDESFVFYFIVSMSVSQNYVYNKKVVFTCSIEVVNWNERERERKKQSSVSQCCYNRSWLMLRRNKHLKKRKMSQKTNCPIREQTGVLVSTSGWAVSEMKYLPANRIFVLFPIFILLM